MRTPTTATGYGRRPFALLRCRSCPPVKGARRCRNVCDFRYADDMLPAVMCRSMRAPLDKGITFSEPVSGNLDIVVIAIGRLSLRITGPSAARA